MACGLRKTAFEDQVRVYDVAVNSDLLPSEEGEESDLDHSPMIAEVKNNAI